MASTNNGLLAPELAARHRWREEPEIDRR